MKRYHYSWKYDNFENLQLLIEVLDETTSQPTLISAHMAIASIHLQTESYGGAVQHYRMALEGVPADIGSSFRDKLLTNLGNAYLKARKPQEAIISYESRSKQDDPVSVFNLALAYCSCGDWENVKEAFISLSDFPTEEENEKHLSTLGQLIVKRDDSDINWVVEVLSPNHSEIAGYFIVLKCIEELKQAESLSAILALASVLRSVHSSHALTLLSFIHLQLGEPLKANAAARSALGLNPYCEAAQINRGLCEKADSWFEAVLQQNACSVEANFHLNRWQAIGAKSPEALYKLSAETGEAPDIRWLTLLVSTQAAKNDIGALRRLAQLHREAGNSDRAEFFERELRVLTC